MKILVTGLSGLVGSRFTELLGDNYQFEEISRSSGVDITDANSVYKAINSSLSTIVLHLAAKTNVDGCEKDKEIDKDLLDKKMDFTNRDTAWAINVWGTKNIVEACKKTGKKLIYVSTDFVFDGERDAYTEKDIPNPINWYAKTKYEGEKLVQDSGLSWIIARGLCLFLCKDFVRVLLDRLYRHERLTMVTDHIMVPTFVDDMVNALDVLVGMENTGIFHVVGSQPLSPYEAALKIAKEFDLDQSIIAKTTRREYFEGKAPRPFYLNLKNDKITKLGIKMSTFDEGLREVKSQIDSIHI
ncbi:MAG: NAD(P)-dependent oxidoreductase [Patescibacteria group bacterium]|nr:NAD(P)-dependent oxidoreductase [Patescibacteria group bacterium]